MLCINVTKSSVLWFLCSWMTLFFVILVWKRLNEVTCCTDLREHLVHFNYPSLSLTKIINTFSIQRVSFSIPCTVRRFIHYIPSYLQFPLSSCVVSFPLCGRYNAIYKIHNKRKERIKWNCLETLLGMYSKWWMSHLFFLRFLLHWLMYNKLPTRYWFCILSVQFPIRI